MKLISLMTSSCYTATRLLTASAGTLLVWSLLTSAATACQVPVFRYALEKWHPDPYDAVIVYRGQLDAAAQQLVSRMSDAQDETESPLNLAVRTMDLDEMSEKAKKELFRDGEPPSELPWLILEYPYYSTVREIAWQGRLTEENVESAIDSPLRQKIVDRLLKGESAVWLLIECGDKKKDDAAAKTLRDELKANQDELKLPDLEVLQNDEFFREETTVELKLAFSLIRVARDGPAEQVFLATLLNSEEDLPADEPIAIPVFGRGRSYYALVGAGINADNLAADCMFLTGPCSCRVKIQNPGIDLLFAVDWDGEIVTSPEKELELPELTGLSGLVAAAEGKATNEPSVEPRDTKTPPQEAEPTESESTTPSATTTTEIDKKARRTADSTGAAERRAKLARERQVALATTDTNGSGSRPAKPSSVPDDSALQTEVDMPSLFVPVAAVFVLGILVVACGTLLMRKRAQ